jgi:hypothetical protein
MLITSLWYLHTLPTVRMWQEMVSSYNTKIRTIVDHVLGMYHAPCMAMTCSVDLERG